MSYSGVALALSGLACYYRQDNGNGSGTMSDSSGLGRNGAYTVSCLSTASTLSGDSNAATLWPHSTSSNRGFKDDIATGGWPGTLKSISVRIKPSTIAAGQRIAVARDWSDGTSNYAMIIGTNTNKVMCAIQLSTGTFITVTGGTVIGTESITQAMMTHDGTTLRLYVNGVLDGSASASGTIKVASWDCIRVGGRGNNTETFSGVIDEVIGSTATLTLSDHQALINESPSSGILDAIATEVLVQPDNSTRTLDGIAAEVLVQPDISTRAIDGIVTQVILKPDNAQRILDCLVVEVLTPTTAASPINPSITSVSGTEVQILHPDGIWRTLRVHPL